MKKLTSLILSLAIMLNTAAGISLPAAAESESIKEYVHNGYTVTYKVVSEWTGNQNISVTIENTGEEEICGWALKYETAGEIDGLWNGKMYSENENTRIVSAQSYNNIIYAGNKVTFGYIISGESFEFPEEMILCNEWTEIDENVEISYEILEDWGSTYQAQVFISNSTEREIDCWKLGFDFTGEISQIWNCVLLNQNESSAFVRNSGATSTIVPDSEVSFSFVGEKNEGEVPELSDFVLYENIINTEKSMEDIILQLMGYADFTDDVLTINWYSTVEEGKFKVLKSSDNESFEVIAELENALSYEYGTIDFEKTYFKVTQLAPDSRYTESAVIAVEYENGECNWEYLDTDKDGIPDVYEESIGTDTTKSDTDDDGLTDYEELYLTNTNPLVYNSVNEELSDAEADCDEDGLSNKTEIQNGTNPLLPDTDYDSINDGEESELGTDPTNSDTDGDGISDGDELTLNLDPTSDTTDGIKDSERTTVQEITADSEVMSEINTEENPMKVSIELEAAGLAESSLDVSESGYSSAMSNSAIVGGIPEFSYPEGLSTGEVTVKFEVSDSVKENTVGDYAESCEELQGIKRFNVFKYFEDTNMLLPIETFHDEEQGIVYTKTDCLGTYCVMDLEIWMQNLGVKPETAELTETTETVEYLSAETVDISYLSSSPSEETENPDDERLNVVFLLDARCSLEKEQFESLKNLVYETATEVVQGYMHRVNLSVVVSCGSDSFFEISTEDVEFFSRLFALSNNAAPEEGDGNLMDITACYDWIYENYKDGSKDTLLIMAVAEEKVMASVKKSSGVYENLVNDEKIHVSLISETRTTEIGSYVVDIITNTNGRIVRARKEAVRDYITEYLPNSYSIITANNYETVVLNDMLQKDSSIDTDKDGLFDWDEVDIEGIYSISDITSKLTPGSSSIRGKSYLTMYDMPTIKQCLAKYEEKCFFVESGFEIFVGEHSDDWKEFIENTRVTPIISDPTNADSDGDKYDDNYEKNTSKTESLHNNAKEYKLMSDYITIIDSENKYYGGFQSWSSIKDRPFVYKEDLSKTGCGVISSCDLLLYIQKTRNIDSLTAVRFNDDESVNIDDYLDFVEKYYYDYKSTFPFPTWYKSVAGKLDAYFKFSGVDYEINTINSKICSNSASKINFDYSWMDNSAKGFLNIICNSIENDRPFILLASSTIESGIYMYKTLLQEYNENMNKLSDIDEENILENHFVTVTGVVSDEVKDDVIIELSSWGTHYYISYKELIEKTPKMTDLYGVEIS